MSDMFLVIERYWEYTWWDMPAQNGWFLQIPTRFLRYGTLCCTKKSNPRWTARCWWPESCGMPKLFCHSGVKNWKIWANILQRNLGSNKIVTWLVFHGISVSSKVSRCRNCVIPHFDIHPQKVFGGQGGCVFEDVDVMNMCFSKNPQQQSRRRHSRRLIWCRWTASIQVCFADYFNLLGSIYEPRSK